MLADSRKTKEGSPIGTNIHLVGDEAIKNVALELDGSWFRCLRTADLREIDREARSLAHTGLRPAPRERGAAAREMGLRRYSASKNFIFKGN